MTRLILTLFLSVAFYSSVARSDDSRKDTMDGTWIPTSAELAGQRMPDDFTKAIKLELKGDEYTVTVGKEVDRGTTKRDDSAKPNSMDITGTEGPNKGKTILAIYERDGDRLKVCYDLSGKARPKEFKSSSGSAHFLVEYKRQKP